MYLTQFNGKKSQASRSWAARLLDGAQDGLTSLSKQLRRMAAFQMPKVANPWPTRPTQTIFAVSFTAWASTTGQYTALFFFVTGFGKCDFRSIILVFFFPPFIPPVKLLLYLGPTRLGVVMKRLVGLVDHGHLLRL